MATWLEDIQTALVNLNGVASYSSIYMEVGRLQGKTLSRDDQATVRKEIERTSSHSKNWDRKRDLFYSVKGIGKGFWGLRAADKPTPSANDINVPETSTISILRIIRDTDLARQIKKLHGHSCQLCGVKISPLNGDIYSDAHHIKPLDSPHKGPDISDNIIVTYHNCHAKLDYFAVSLSLQNIIDIDRRKISQ